jgi:hypothetical protein
MRVQKYAFALSFAKELGKLMVFYFDNSNLVDIPTLKALKESILFKFLVHNLTIIASYGNQ